VLLGRDRQGQVRRSEADSDDVMNVPVAALGAALEVVGLGIGGPRLSWPVDPFGLRAVDAVDAVDD
jgi:hypothetical protein